MRKLSVCNVNLTLGCAKLNKYCYFFRNTCDYKGSITTTPMESNPVLDMLRVPLIVSIIRSELLKNVKNSDQISDWEIKCLHLILFRLSIHTFFQNCVTPDTYTEHVNFSC